MEGQSTIHVKDKGAIYVVPGMTRLEVKIEQQFADYTK